MVHVWQYGSAGSTPTDLGSLNRYMPQLAAGVLLFFTLSGFLLYRPYAAAIVRKDAAVARRYARNRALRILPTYWVVLLAVEFVFHASIVRTETGALDIGRLTDEPVCSAANLTLVQGYHPNTLVTGIGPAWSLVIEVAFYAALPLLGWIGLIVARGRAGPAGLVLHSCRRCSCSRSASPPRWPSRQAAGRRVDASWTSVAARSFVANADLFAFGMMLTIVRLQDENGHWRIPTRWRTSLARRSVSPGLYAVFVIDGELGEARYDTVFTLAMALVLLPLLGTAQQSPRARQGSAPWTLARSSPSGSRRTACSSGTSRCCAGSATAAGRGVVVAPAFFDLSLVAVVAGLLAAITYRLVERPALRRKRSHP